MSGEPSDSSAPTVAESLSRRDARGLAVAVRELRPGPARTQAQHEFWNAVAAAESPAEIVTLMAMLTPGILKRLPVDRRFGGAARGMEGERLAGRIRAASDLAPDSRTLALIYVRLLDRLERRAEIAPFLAGRGEVFDDVEALMQLDHLAPRDSATRAAITAHIEELDTDSPADIRRRAVRWLLDRGEIEAACDVAARLEVDVDRAETGEATRLVSRAPPGWPRLAPIDEDREVMIGRSEGDRGAVLLFRGRGDDKTTMAHVIDRHVASLGLSLVYLRDEHRLLYLQGLRSLAPDRASTIARLKEILAGMGPIYVIGISAGGAGAVLYGVELGARAALCFSPVTDLRPSVREIDKRGRAVEIRVLGQYDANGFDMLPILEGAAMPVTIYYGRDHPEDRYHAERMADCPNVTLCPIVDSPAHATLLEVGMRENLSQVFARAFGLDDRTVEAL